MHLPPKQTTNKLKLRGQVGIHAARDWGQFCSRSEAVNKEVGPDDQVKIANYLCPGNYAVSGGIKGIDLVAAKAKPEFKARMAVKLAVAGERRSEGPGDTTSDPCLALRCSRVHLTRLTTPRECPSMTGTSSCP